jgi:hypothetical protein
MVFRFVRGSMPLDSVRAGQMEDLVAHLVGRSRTVVDRPGPHRDYNRRSAGKGAD